MPVKRTEVLKSTYGNIAFFAILGLVSSVVAATVTLSPLPEWCRRLGAPYLPLFGLILLFVLLCLSFALGHPQKPKEVTATTLLLMIPGTSLALTFLGLRYPSWPTGLWLLLLIWNGIALITLWPGIRTWKDFLLLLAAIWTISTVACSLGELELFPYAREPLANLRGIHFLLDVRLLLGELFLIIFAGTAFVRTLTNTPPRIKTIPLKVIPKPEGRVPAPLAFALTSLIFFLNLASLVLLHWIPNLIWKAMAMFFAYAFFTAREGLQLAKEVSSKRALLILWRVCAAFALSLALAALADHLVTPASTYLLSSNWAESWKSLGSVAAHGALMFLLTVGLALAIYPRSSVKDYAWFGPSYVMLVMALVGLALCVVSLSNRFNLVGFKLPGPFTAIFLAAVLVGLFFLLGKGVTEEAETTKDGLVDSGPGWITSLGPATFTIAALAAALVLLILFLSWQLLPGIIEHWAENRKEEGLSPEKIPSNATPPAIGRQGARLPKSPPLIIVPSAPETSPAPAPGVEPTPSGLTRPRDEIPKGSDPSRKDKVRSSALVTLSVEPNDASVALDYKVLGQANYLKPGIRVNNGVHRLRISKEGYFSHYQLLEVKRGKDLSVEIQLERKIEEEALAELDSNEPTPPITPSWLRDRDAIRYIRGLEVLILYRPKWYRDARSFRERLQQLGARVVVEPVDVGRAKKRGIYFSQPQTKAASAMKKVSERDLRLYIWDKHQEQVVVYLVDHDQED